MLLRILILSMTLWIGSNLIAQSALQETIAEKDLRQLVDLYVGEFNNYNQVNFQSNDFLENPPKGDYSRLHTIRKRVTSDKLDGHWVYAQTNVGDRDSAIYRQVYSHFFINDQGQIASRAYNLKDTSAEKIMPTAAFFAAMTMDQVDNLWADGCDIIWRRELDQFVGEIAKDGCIIDSKYKDEKRSIFAKEILGTKGIWSLEGAHTLDGKLAFGNLPPDYYRSHRTRSFKCWAAIDLGIDDWEYHSDLMIHDQGGEIAFGDKKKYRIQLKQTDFPATTYSNVFELFVYRNDDEKAFSYTWTQPGAEHIAINLREVQASCKLVE